MASFSVLFGIWFYSRGSIFSTFRQANIDQSFLHFGTTPIPTASSSQYAVAIFLGKWWDEKDSDGDDIDSYYVAARTLVYQLLYAPETKFTSPVSVVILATEAVRESKRQRLRADGAIVVDTERLNHSLEIGVAQYREVFDKLRAFDPTVMPFEKVALIDADMVVTRPLDALFQDTNTTLSPVDNSKLPAADLPELPDSYTFAATPDIPARKQIFPPDVDNEWHRDYFNAGVMLSSPNDKLFQYYLAILAQPDIFGHMWPEQDLLNFAHRWDGPMPWRQLNLSWHLKPPLEVDVDAGMAMLHCKYWESGEDSCHRISRARRWQMQGFWEGIERKNIRA
ncbi:uncharacterized protein N7496_010569 [Penicillium cataractarum]|uniref:Glycosyltransferase family 8 protein n=1 Tax=Penicillium cataractarum TaxID=2100454 RepID=A0A9W9V3H3_9EURO|nr:uncharacterized protein N7496_010569 [Penicillium cataractarum]KAJ5364856.1 hypothetical protein N7496_010569 [Penicillium cataractarum]